MDSTRKLWVGLAALLIASFSVLLWSGREINGNAAPMPEQVVATDGTFVYTRADMERGRQVWPSMGGMQLGSIWATAPRSHLIGAPIGCTAKQSRCATCARARLLRSVGYPVVVGAKRRTGFVRRNAPVPYIADWHCLMVGFG